MPTIGALPEAPHETRRRHARDLTPYRDQRVYERVTAQSASLTTAHPVDERRPDERDAADHHERVGTTPPRVVGQGTVVAVTADPGTVDEVVVTFTGLGAVDPEDEPGKG